jgi:predicted transcriptional regulator YheO
VILEENLNFEFVINLLEGVQELLGSNCEIIVHDFRKGYEQSIVHALNSQLSGRDVGGKPRGALIMNLGKDIETLKKSKVLFYKGEKGQIFKSCSTLIGDSSNRVIGSICINIEVSQLLGVNSMLNEFLSTTSKNEILKDKSAIMAQNVDDVLQYYISTCEQMINSSMELMNKEQKIKAISFLYEKGVFKITKANMLLCERFQISKYTLYKYLEEAKNL